MKTLSLKIFAVCGVIGFLSACGSSEPSPWTKKSSPWDQERTQQTQRSSSIDAEAPAAASYKSDLEAVDQSLQEVDLSYQSQPVDSFVPEAEVEPVADAAPMEESLSAEDEVLNQPADYYTVQLMASVDKDRAYKFAEKHQLSSRYIVATHRGDAVWYVLLLGIYPDYSTAKAEMNAVADRFKTAPWIRKLGGIQKLMQ